MAIPIELLPIATRLLLAPKLILPLKGNVPSSNRPIFLVPLPPPALISVVVPASLVNVPVSVEVYDGMQHLFQVISPVQVGRVSINRMGQFIRARAAETDLSFLFAKLAAR